MSKLVNELYYGQTVNSKSRCLTYCVVAVSENRHLNNCINFSEKTRLSEGNKTGTCSPTPFLLGFFYNIYKKKKIYMQFFFSTALHQAQNQKLSFMHHLLLNTLVSSYCQIANYMATVFFLYRWAKQSLSLDRTALELMLACHIKWL